MSEVVNYAVEKAIKDKYIDLLEFTKANPCNLYYENIVKYVKSYPYNPVDIDMTSVGDETIVKRIVGFLWYKMNPDRRHPKIFRNIQVAGIRKMLEYTSQEAKNNYVQFKKDIFLIPDSCKNIRAVNTCANQFIRYCKEADCENDIFASDYWHLYHMNIDETRFSLSGRKKHIDFSHIKNEENRSLVKLYLRDRILFSDISVNTIVGISSRLNVLLNTQDIAYPKWSKNNGDLCIKALRDRNLKDRTISGYLIVFEGFTEFLIINDYIKDSPIKHLHELTHFQYEYKATAEDKYVLTQIFNALGSFEDLSLVICFLLIYCTGMRVSEACEMERDCLENKSNHFFVRFYQDKMDKYVINEIPKALFKLISDYRKEVPSDSKWLFPGKRIKYPRGTTAFRNNFKEELNRFEIKRSDGSLYNFTPHAFRHLMAVRMREEDIPFQYIQEQLHHESPEMTMAYTEFLDRQKIAKMKRFVDSNGSIAPIGQTLQVANDEQYAEYLRSYINAQILPNGLCNRPVKLGKCKHCNACLKCKDFRTTPDFLEVHENQLKHTEQYILIAEKNGWSIQANAAKEERDILINLINKLKGLLNG